MIRLLHEQIINVSSVGPLSFSLLLTFYNGTSKLVPRQNSTMNPHFPHPAPSTVNLLILLLHGHYPFAENLWITLHRILDFIPFYQ